MHIVSPPSPQPATQLPFVHVVPPAHRTPHPPQLLLSISGFAQIGPQRSAPGAQAHWPPTQLAPAGHCVPHALQLSGSAAVLTHASPHFVRPAAQLTLHPPSLHSGVPPSALQTTPQPPQLFGSLTVRVQTPLQRIPSKHWHEPFWHVVPAAHCVLQPPQCKLSAAKLTHTPPQELDPAGHPHAPFTHESPRVASQTTPHPPQLLGSLRSGMQLPLQ
jgi:hypothetical protein